MMTEEKDSLWRAAQAIFTGMIDGAKLLFFFSATTACWKYLGY